MNGNCHFLYATAVSGMVALNLEQVNHYLPNIENEPSMIALLLMGGIIGGVFPDIDNPKSHIGQLTKPVSTVIGKIGESVGKSGTHHRGIFHDFLIYAVGLVLSYFYCPYLLGFFIGVVTHLFLDMFNPMGVPVLFGVTKMHLGKIRSDSKSAIVLTYILTGLTLLIGIIIKCKIINLHE